jgi:hypothetical protein
MLWLALMLALAGRPFLGTILAMETPAGWKCSAVCHTSGNDDGGYCRDFTFAKDMPSEAECKAELGRQCTKAKPPPGGCRAGREGQP